MQQADDAAALIAALGGGPAHVFGTSGGAQIGLDLAARHPQLVDTLVAHEPPAIMMLPDPSEAIAADRDLHETYLREGVDAAMAKFFAMAGFDEGSLAKMGTEKARAVRRRNSTCRRRRRKPSPG